MKEWKQEEIDPQRESNGTCCICTCEYESGEEVMVFPCHDMFHKGTINPFLSYRLYRIMVENQMDLSIL